MNNPTISVLMSVHNGEAYLSECLESILNQTVRDFEFLIVNDGSTDSTPNILNTYAHKDSRIRVFNHPNSGLVDALNWGAKHALGKFIARMDADDVARIDRFELQLKAFEKIPGLGALGGAVEIINAGGSVVNVHQFVTSHDEIRAELLAGLFPICHPTVMMNADAFRQTGGYRKLLADAEDFDLWLRMSEQFELANLDQVVIQYRRHGQQISVKRLRRQIQSHLAAHASAQARIQKGADPLEFLDELTPETLKGLGVKQQTWDNFFVRRHLVSAQALLEARDTAAAESTIDLMLETREWKSAPKSLIADAKLLAATICWQQKRYLECLALGVSALLVRPQILGRPLKGLLKKYHRL